MCGWGGVIWVVWVGCCWLCGWGVAGCVRGRVGEGGSGEERARRRTPWQTHTPPTPLQPNPQWRRLSWTMAPPSSTAMWCWRPPGRVSHPPGAPAVVWLAGCVHVCVCVRAGRRSASRAPSPNSRSKSPRSRPPPRPPTPAPAPPLAVHTRATLVSQGARSAYSLTEARVGGALTRHDVGVDQLGAETNTQVCGRVGWGLGLGVGCKGVRGGCVGVGAWAWASVCGAGLCPPTSRLPTPSPPPHIDARLPAMHRGAAARPAHQAQAGSPARRGQPAAQVSALPCCAVAWCAGCVVLCCAGCVAAHRKCSSAGPPPARPCSPRRDHDAHTHTLAPSLSARRCIVTHATGRGVFDGSVRVNRLAQKTDAQQVSRNLLLAPRATVNVKPNLQARARGGGGGGGGGAPRAAPATSTLHSQPPTPPHTQHTRTPPQLAADCGGRR